MRIVKSVSMALAVVALSAPVLVASDKAAPSKDVSTAVETPKAEVGQFAALKGIKAAPMSAIELKKVKGQHAHFVTVNSNNELFGETGLHVVNRNNLKNWSDLYGDGDVGPGYHGLCRAALNSPGIWIPGQSDATGHGGGC